MAGSTPALDPAPYALARFGADVQARVAAGGDSLHPRSTGLAFAEQHGTVLA
jgi:hypothetical protein